MTYSSNPRTDEPNAQRILDQYPYDAQSKQGKILQSSISNRVAKQGFSERGNRRRKKDCVLLLPDIRVKLPQLFQTLVDLSRQSYIYYGFYGYGATKKLLKSLQYNGTQAVLEKQEAKLPRLQFLVLENMALEGSVFATYDSLILHIKKSKETHP